MTSRLDLTGQKFGRLTAVRLADDWRARPLRAQRQRPVDEIAEAVGRGQVVALQHPPAEIGRSPGRSCAALGAARSERVSSMTRGPARVMTRAAVITPSCCSGPCSRPPC